MTMLAQMQMMIKMTNLMMMTNATHDEEDGRR